MREKLKIIVSFLCIMLFLPYVCAVLFQNVGETRQSWNTLVSPQQPVENTIEQLLIGVLAAQISPDYELETYKAQAVLARTGLYKMQKEQGTESVQVEKLSQYMSMGEMERTYGSEEREKFYGQLSTAIRETKGVVIKYQGNYIEPFFHAVSSGKSRNGNTAFHSDGYGYLQEVENGYDILAPNYVTVLLLSKEDVAEKINSAIHSNISSENILENIEIIHREEGGYVTELTIGGKKIAGEEFRHFLDLNSSCFYLDSREDDVQITTKGLGHGIGMSQYNANELAKEGKTYQEILTYYFKDIELVSE